ncbi:MAG: glycosyltransferase [Edaphobacter sp.]|uniref:glycosyltransferase family protein n=1 Tax=Edaphobacter sp. TaxID=1934404 RepID=UPI0023876CA3|nr:glycosyltransferase [Edaphobacter sp.]MDE1178843.1 glycosyltransferase [Edaphobacter sp.]
MGQAILNATSETTKQRTAYFFLGRTPDGRFLGYPHQAILFAEGLRALGWRIVSDVETWRPQPDAPFLFPGDVDAPRPADCDLLVVAEDYFMLQGSPALPVAITSCSVPAVFLDRRDLGDNLRDLYSKPYERFAAIFRTHGNRRFRYPANLRQMVFGISDRIAEASVVAASEVVNEPREGLIWNFRHKQFPHTVRVWAEKEVRPVLESGVPFRSEVDPEVENNLYDNLMLRQTEGRHFPAYYRRMASSTMAACFGGWFLLPVPQQEAGPACMWGRRVMKSLGRTSTMIAQWDSWRMWEAFAAGTAVLHLDMERNGFLFDGPQPEPMKHYIAVSLDRPAESLRPLLDHPDEVRRIGEAGRIWALEHYTSRPIAARMLKEIGLG